MVLVSAGFDASMGHMPQLGGYRVSPACYGYMTKELMQLANGKVSTFSFLLEFLPISLYTIKFHIIC